MCWCCPFVAGLSWKGHAEDPPSTSRTIDCKLGHAHPSSLLSSFGNPHFIHKGFCLSPSLYPSHCYSGTRPRAEPLIHTRESTAVPSVTTGHHSGSFKPLLLGLSFHSPPSPCILASILLKTMWMSNAWFSRGCHYWQRAIVARLTGLVHRTCVGFRR